VTTRTTTVVALLLLAIFGTTLAVEAQSRNPALDFKIPQSSGTGNIRALWSNGTTMWVSIGSAVRAYDLSTGTRAIAKDVFHGQQVGVGIWSDSATMWVSTWDGILAYTLATGRRDQARDIAKERAFPGHLWSDGATIWLSRGTYLLAYNLASGDRSPAKDIALEGQTAVGVTGLWSDGDTIWTPLAYNLTSGTRDESKDWELGRARHGLWSDGTTLWAGHHWSGRVLAYDVATGNRERPKDIRDSFLTVGHIWSIWSDGTTMWVLTGGAGVGPGGNQWRAYDTATRNPDPAKEWDLELSEGTVDLWSDGGTAWVARRAGRDARILAYDVATQTRNPAKDLREPVPLGRHDARLWSDGTTMWVTSGNEVYAFNVVDGTREPSRDFDGHDEPILCIWSNGTTMWLCGANDVWAYDVATWSRDPAKDFVDLKFFSREYGYTDVPYAPRDLWSDGTTMWIARYGSASFSDPGAYILAYDLATREPVLEKDFTASMLSPGVAASTDIVSDGVTMWLAHGNLYAYNLTMRTREPTRDFFRILPEDQLRPDVRGIWNDGTIMWVLEGIYRYGQGRRLHPYDLATGESLGSLPAMELGDDYGSARGLWSDGATMWTAASGSSGQVKLVAYDMGSRSRDSGKDVVLEGLFEPDGGLWSDGVTVWVQGRGIDAAVTNVKAFMLKTGAPVPERDIIQRVDEQDGHLIQGGDYPIGIWSDGATMWVARYIRAGRGQVDLLAYDMPPGVRVVNRRPVTIAYLPDRTVTPGTGMEVDLSRAFVDPDGDALTYTVSSSAAQVAAASAAGAVVTLTALSEGTATIGVAATDPGGLSATQVFTVTVSPTNRPPEAVGTLLPLTMEVGESAVTVEVGGAFRDPDGDALTYAASTSAPSVASVSLSGSGVTVAPVSEGSAVVTVTATDVDGSNTAATQSFTVTVGRFFTDHPIVPGETPVRAVHFTELRTRINALRSVAGMGRFAWTDPVLRAGVTRVRLVHLLELRSALAAAYAAAGRPAPRWSDASPVGGTTPIRAAHLMELRAAVVALE